MKSSPTFLGPVNQLPSEGTDIPLTGKSAVDACASLFSGSSLVFDVSLDGAILVSNPQDSELFQLFSLEANENALETFPRWYDEAYEVSLQSLFPDDGSFRTLSDASAPEDFVRRFLEVLGSSLNRSIVGHHGATLPLIRWEEGEDANSARVQLLGILLADDAQFETFCRENQGEFGFVFEDAEVEARGVRETLTVLALIGITLGSATHAEAGLFKNFGKKKEMRIQQVAHQNSVRQSRGAIQQSSQSGYQDVHRDAYINRDLLQSGKDGNKKIVVDVSKQRAYLIVNNQIALDTAISTARSGKYTPRGQFKITERVQSGKTSTIYGCDLPYWQRLDQSPIGLHVGDLPGYPASAGCIRLPESVAPILFANTASGVTVEVVDSWNPASLNQSIAQQNIIVAEVVPQQQEG